MKLHGNGRGWKEKDEDEKKLEMSGMSLYSIPSTSLSLKLTSITKLDLSDNNLTSIPESMTARLLNVEVMDVHSNELTMLPNSLGCLKKLKVLNVSGNMIQCLPKSIEDCKELVEVNANFNKLTRLPDTMGFELTKLRKLTVNSNKLAALPYSTSHLAELRVLDARLNCLQSIPDELQNLTKLEVLNVSQNFQHLDTLPYSIGLLMSLTELDVSYNRITILPESLTCLTKLRKLRAEGNPLKTPPPAVLEKGVEAVREYLGGRMRNRFKFSRPVRRSWIGSMVKCGTFTGRTLPRGDEDQVSYDESRTYHSFDGFVSPKARAISLAVVSPRLSFGMLSPRHLLSLGKKVAHNQT